MGAAMDDQRLVALAQEGNPDAFSLLVERHQTMVYNLALGKTGSPQDAEEVTQTAFLKAWQGLPAFQGKAAFSSWLYRLTVNAAIDLLRQRSRRPQTLSLDDPDLPPVPDPAEDPTTDPGLSQAEAQSLLIAYLAQQGRTLELIPLGQSGDVWRFSGRESDGTVVSFFMVSRTDGTISEVPVPPTDTGPSVGDAN